MTVFPIFILPPKGAGPKPFVTDMLPNHHKKSREMCIAADFV